MKKCALHGPRFDMAEDMCFGIDVGLILVKKRALELIRANMGLVANCALD